MKRPGGEIFNQYPSKFPRNLDNKPFKTLYFEGLSRFRKYLKGLYRNEAHGEGGQPYDVIQMFKALLLQQWHSLSDTDLEKSLRTRLDCMLFTRFGLEGVVRRPMAQKRKTLLFGLQGFC